MSTSFAIGQHVRILGGIFASYEGEVVATTPATVTVAVTMFGKVGNATVALEDVDPVLHARKVAETTLTERQRSQERQMQEEYALHRLAGDDREAALDRVADQFNSWRVTERDPHGEPVEVRPSARVRRVCRD